MVTVEQAEAGDLGRIQELISSVGLPPADTAPDASNVFLVARSGERIVGCVAVEFYEDGGLLRSFAVEEDARGTGTGDALLIAAEELARSRGLAAIYLLTTTATTYFVVRGWRLIERDVVPPRVRTSHEFTTLCPSDAICLWLPLVATPIEPAA